MNDIDFLPESYLQQQVQRALVYRRWVLLIMTALCLTGWGVARHRGTAELRYIAQNLQAKVLTNQQQLSEFAKLRQEHATLVYQLKTQRQLDQPVALTQALAMFGRLMPDSAGLTHILVKTSRPEPKPLADPKNQTARSKSKRKTRPQAQADNDYLEIEVKGIAPDDVTVAQLDNSLSDHPLFEQVKMFYSRSDERGGLIGRRFHVGARVPLDRRYLPITQTAEVADED